MKIHFRTFPVSVLSLAAVISLLSMGVLAQNKAETKAEYKSKDREFCANNSWSDENRSQFRDTREMTLPATGSLNVDGGQNGGVRIIGENRSDIQLRACIQTWADSDDAAKALAGDIRIETGGTIRAVNSSGSKNWSVSYEVRAPRNTSLSLKAHNGGISISGVEGNLEFETMNGGVVLRDVAGDVRGRTTNGGVVVSLAGSSWKGNGLDVQTTNGGVVLNMADNYAAHVETGTVNGGFKSDFPALNVDRTEKWKPARISADLNGGGPTIRVITTNGGVKIGSSFKGDKE